MNATCLIELALPLEAESAVDKELADERDEGHDDGNTVFISDHLLDPSRWELGDLPEDDDCGDTLANWYHTTCVGNVLNGQISVGMFLSWRMRWDTVWAVYGHCEFYRLL